MSVATVVFVSVRLARIWERDLSFYLGADTLISRNILVNFIFVETKGDYLCSV
jgi:hypothetical protein